jgi:hypothetical protein
MKNIFNLLHIVPFLFGYNLFGQDVIFMNSKEEIKTKVIEIDEHVVKYKKFDFQEGPIYSVKKTDIFLIIYSNGTREIFNQTDIDQLTPGPEGVNNELISNKQKLNPITPSTPSKIPELDNTSKPARTLADQRQALLFKRGNKVLGIGLGTGVLLGYAGGLTSVNIPYLSARLEKIYIQIGENMSVGGGVYAGYHAYSVGVLGVENTFSVISGGLSGTYYYSISEKFAVGAGLRTLYESFSNLNNYGYDIGPVGKVNIHILGSAHYNASRKMILFSEVSSGISNINLGIQFIL